MAIAQASRKRKHKKRRKKRKHGKPVPTPTPGATGSTPPPPPPPPQKYAHILGWEDPGDGLVRPVIEWVDDPPTDTPPPRPLPKPQDPPAPKSAQPFGTYSGPFGRVQAKRLLDRAGFGPKPGQAVDLAGKGLQAAVYSLTRPSGSANLIGPDPVDEDGVPIAPIDAWGHDHLWWLDRMIRSDQPLVERMALVFHDWFATSNDKVGKAQLMIDQSNLFRFLCFSSFRTLLENVTQNPAMLLWLDGVDNTKKNPNENYAREVQELFTLGADRGAYTEDDVRELARCFTGFRYDWDDTLGPINFRYDPNRHDTTNKTVYGHTGNWTWQDGCRLCVENPMHASFFVKKLWSYFIPQPPSSDTVTALAGLYTSNSYAIRPVLEAILMHPDFYEGPAMVKPPVVLLASMMRATQTFITDEKWYWLSRDAGQMLFYPPNVAGWDDNRWLDTNTMRGRWLCATEVLDYHHVEVWDGSYDP
ncbi:MAG TPA: DUF1800 domain-containing protein, partial [Myxococcaceae bacterium]|nr:DUF1800 domain-containing protein [Myxococcaceae bacterium]